MLPEGKCSHLSWILILTWDESPSWHDCLIQNYGGCLDKKLTPVTQLLEGQIKARRIPAPIFVTQYSRLHCLHVSEEPTFEALVFSEVSRLLRSDFTFRSTEHSRFSLTLYELIEHNVFEKENTFPHL